MVSITLTEDQTFAAIGGYLVAILPPGTPIVRGQVNRVPEVAAPNFVIMWPLLRERIETNTDSYADSVFEGSVAGGVLTVTSVSETEDAPIVVGSNVFGVGLAVNTVVTGLLTGEGGTGTYSVSPSQTLATQVMAAGTAELLAPTKLTVQLDVHGPASADNAQKVSTTFRDEWAVDQFASSGLDVTPLYCEDPRQVPFLNAESQYEDRWTIDIHLQVNPVVVVPQQFADAVALDVVSVDEAFPAT